MGRSLSRSVTRSTRWAPVRGRGVLEEGAADALAAVLAVDGHQGQVCLDVAVALEVRETHHQFTVEGDHAGDARRGEDGVRALGVGGEVRPVVGFAQCEDAREVGFLVLRDVHGSVRTSAPVSVTTRVCSNWAVRDLSLVVAVQPSSHRSYS